MKRVREVEMLGALVAGVVLGGVIIFTLLSYFWEWGVMVGARWWDVMTAVGTVGAVAASSFYWVLKKVEESALRASIAKVKAANYSLAIRGPLNHMRYVDGIAEQLREAYDSCSPDYQLKVLYFRSLLIDLKPFFSESDCHDFYYLDKDLAGWMSMVLGGYSRINDEGLYKLDSYGRFSTESFRVIGFTVKTIRVRLAQSQRAFMKLRSDISMDATAGKDWLDWKK